MPRGAIAFDVDGTLVPNTSSSQFLAGYLGHLDTLAEAEDAYSLGDLDNFEVSVLDAAGWAGARRSDIDRWLAHLPLVDGIQDVVDWCRAHDLVPMVATLAWAPVGEHLVARYGFHSSSGPVPALERGRYTGRVERHLDEYGKRDAVVQTVAELGLTMGECAAIGDSRSDLPLFTVSAFTIAFNASADLRERASASVTGNDLRAVIPKLTQWLQQSTPPS